MTETELESYRYPIGRFKAPFPINEAMLKGYIETIETLPQKLEEAVEDWSDEQLATPYREGGWTVRQTIHHIADSHFNSQQRFRLALTEDRPAIVPYIESAWAELPDAKSADIALSLTILKGLHARWTILLKSFGEKEWAREFIHPEFPQPLRLDTTAALYDWHSRHHLTHITNLKDRKGW
ncbi:bacillithiol transferase BstA [Flammeovirgaceae bacterium SG7u.111]|nr:bacillithiol transferase BstA [Flammeovirgaceae bacterium SG7u.132]WPO38075.1 bacillithiol transferase BstA [Flammeovirgaceae bacterium SG7u.111]